VIYCPGEIFTMFSELSATWLSTPKLKLLLFN
jgi:hypothetical protein